MMVSSNNLYLNHQANMKTMSEIQNSTEQSANNSSLYFGGSSLTSGNWAGYVSKYSNFNSIQGSWVVQSITTDFSGGPTAAQWMGIGGFSGTNLIQAGTISMDTPFWGTYYRAFYELYPQSSPVYLRMTVKPGNIITASISEVSTNYWHIEIKDITTIESYSGNFSFDPNQQSAEWIEELPQGSSSLADFGTAEFGPYFTSQISNLANGNPISFYNYYDVTIVNSSGATMAYPSPLVPGTGSHSQPPYFDSFSVSWVRGS